MNDKKGKDLCEVFWLSGSNYPAIAMIRPYRMILNPM